MNPAPLYYMVTVVQRTTAKKLLDVESIRYYRRDKAKLLLDEN